MRHAGGAVALTHNPFAEQHQVPVAATWKNQDVFDNTSPLYAGHLGFGTPAAHKDILADADLIIALGTRLGDIASQNFSFPAAPQPVQWTELSGLSNPQRGQRIGIPSPRHKLGIF